jgi:hypothetical protein
MRIAYVLLTCEKYATTRVPWQLKTSLLSVPHEDIYYLGHTMDPTKRLFHWGAKDDYDSLPQKMLDFFVNMSMDSYDWIIIADDDTYLFHKRIQRFLSVYRHRMENTLTVFGHLLDHIKKDYFEYYSGGAGTILSKALFDEIQKEVKTHENPLFHWCADICLGKWLLDINARLPISMNNLATFLHPEYYNPKKNNAAIAFSFHHLKEKKHFDELYALE